MPHSYVPSKHVGPMPHMPSVNYYKPASKPVGEVDAHQPFTYLDTSGMEEALDRLKADLDRMEARIIACVQKHIKEGEDGESEANTY